MTDTIKRLIIQYNFFSNIIADTEYIPDYQRGYYDAMEEMIKLMCADAQILIKVISRQGKFKECREIKIL